MDNKNYLWIGIGVIAVIIAVLLVMKTADKSDLQTTPGTAETGTDSLINNNTGNQVADNASETPVVDTLVLSEETIIEVDGNSFSPKIVNVQAGQKVFMTVSALDEAKHSLSFSDASLSYISVNFDKAEGAKSITFPAPAPGTYSFFIDDETNAGQLIVE